MSSRILKSSRYGAHILMLLVNCLLYIKFSRLSLLLGNFLVQRCVRVHAHTRMCLYRHMRVQVCVEQLPVRSGVLTVCLPKQMVFMQFKADARYPYAVLFYLLNQIYCENMCNIWWWFLAYLFISTESWIFSLLYLFVSFLVEDSLAFTELINSFYSPVLLSFSINFFESIIFIHWYPVL